MEGQALKRDFFSLTYTDHRLKIVKIKKNKIVSVASSEIPAGVVKDGKIERHKMFADLLGELKRNAKPKKITAKEIVAAIPEEKVFLKIIEIPKMPVEKIDSAIAWQLESIIPFKEKDVYYNWRIVGENQGKLRLLIDICEREIADSLLEALNIAKQKTLIIGFPSASIANLLTSGNHLSIIIDLSKQDNVFLIAAKNKSVYFSSSRHIGNNYNELEKIILSTVSYYSKKFPNERIGKILIYGPPRLSQYEEKLKNIYKENNSIDIQVIKNIKEEYVSYIDNLGLNFGIEDLSLLPPQIRENTKNESINYKFSSIINYFVLVIIFLGIIYALAWGKIYLDINNLQNKYNNIKNFQTSDEQNEIEKKISSLNEKIAIINSIDFSSSISPEIVEDITSSTDDNVRIKDVEISKDNAVTIKGTAKSRNDLILYKDNLNKLDIMETISLPLTALEDKEDVDFELETSLKIRNITDTNNEE